MRPPGREEWGILLEHKIGALRRSGAALQLGSAADADAVRALRPDVAVIATGAAFDVPRLPGAEMARVLSVDAAVADPSKVGRRVLVIDYLDRHPALVTAIMLAQGGRAVTIATPSLQVGLKLELQNLTEFYRRAYAAKVSMMTLARPLSAAGGEVRFRNPIGGQVWSEGPFDSIVIAEPGRPRGELADELAHDGIEVRVIGDAYAPRDVEAAVLEGFETGRCL